MDNDNLEENELNGSATARNKGIKALTKTHGRHYFRQIFICTSLSANCVSVDLLLNSRLSDEMIR